MDNQITRYITGNKLNQIETGRKSYQLHNEVCFLKLQINRNFLELGKRLKQIRDEKLYKELDYNTFEAYIAQPELSFKRSGIYALIGIWEDFIKSGVSNRLDIEQIDWSKLDRIRQFKSKPDFSKWIEKARTLSLSDLNEEIKETSDPTPPCPHRQVEILLRCARCRERLGFRRQGRDSVVELGKIIDSEGEKK